MSDVVSEVLKRMHTEEQSEAHTNLRSYKGNNKKNDPNEASVREVPGIDHPGSTGVIYVMDRAMKLGFKYDDPSWANFGQGAPETGNFPGANAKPEEVSIPYTAREYAPATGIKELREKVANYYNELYRKDKTSKYTYENICIVPGGRAGLTRVAAAIGDVNVGYQLPEYTAYESMLSIFKRFTPIPTTLEEEDAYRLHPEKLKKEIKNRGLSVLVASNPRNPTGQILEGEELKKCVELAKGRTTLVFDEFYSWYIYTHPEEENGRTVSIAEYVDEVDEDSVVIIDGLTKNWRLPGWRVCWVVGPKNFIDAMNSAGSFLEGGANHPLQLAALPLLDMDFIRRDINALQKHFRGKRNHVLKRLEEMGLPIKVPPQATFYVWLDIKDLPEGLNNGLTFFEECLKEKVIVVPGVFFDINPSSRRELFDSPCHHFVRLSFGPPQEELDRGLDGLVRVLNKHGYKKKSLVNTAKSVLE